MSQQTVPAVPAGVATSVLSASSAFSETQQMRSWAVQVELDIIALRNSLDAAITIFNAHTHKTPTSNPGATSTPTSDTGGSGSTGGTASSQTAPANTVTTV